MDMQKYIVQHNEIRSMLEQLSGFLQEIQLIKKTDEVTALLFALSRKIASHFDHEQQQIYDYVLSLSNSVASETAGNLFEEFREHRARYDNYLNRWSEMNSIKMNASSFISETRKFIDDLVEIMERERAIIFPILRHSAE